MRLFIGLNIPATVQERLQKIWEQTMHPEFDIRSIELEKWHFTLTFLDDVEPENIEALKLLIENAIDRPPQAMFRFTHFETFPHKNPSYVVVRADVEHLNEWTSFIERLRDMVSLAAPNVDRKPWIPHLSIARAKKGNVLPGWSAKIDSIEWTPDALTLIQSEVGPLASHYTNLHVFPFHI